ncbi:c-type cytochrome [Chryseobacterium hagamense]|uniref:Cytochrome c551 n=1 Tax=Chryseobacterium hagamense TaxID=395935 RepID=A0A511YSN3_9FLAO|nr:c-type cytochrome [Chryseobacterium hagamense]GEN78193.1 cytochrome c551 [Chryseobacterium hagamense]
MMRNLFLAGGVAMLMFSCSKKETPSADSGAETAHASNPGNSNLSGDKIMEALDCSGCHAVNEKMIGPSYQQIADKYSEKDTELLASKIIEGGSGVWGGVPMSPHPQVSKEDAKKMVQYILSLKK